MTEDKTYYKVRYQDSWDDGNRRELIVQSFLESLGFEVEITGFMALSNEFNPESPPEKAIPDFAIYNNIGEKIWIEVTGTNDMKTTAKLWIRPDKIDYARDHRHEGQVFVAHVVTLKSLLRFVDATNIPLHDLSITEVNTHNHFAKFYEIPFKHIISQQKMKSKLLGWKNKYW